MKGLKTYGIPLQLRMFGKSQSRATVFFLAKYLAIMLHSYNNQCPQVKMGFTGICSNARADEILCFDWTHFIETYFWIEPGIEICDGVSGPPRK